MNKTELNETCHNLAGSELAKTKTRALSQIKCVKIIVFIMLTLF